MGGFGGMDELAVLCALFSCTLILMTHEDDPDHVHLKGLMAIYKPSAAARAQLGNPSPFGTAEVAIFHVDAFEALQYLSSDERPTTILLELKNNHVCGFLGPAAERPLSCISQARAREGPGAQGGVVGALPAVVQEEERAAQEDQADQEGVHALPARADAAQG